MAYKWPDGLKRYISIKQQVTLVLLPCHGFTDSGQSYVTYIKTYAVNN